MFSRLRQKLRTTGFAARLAVTVLSVFLIIFNLGLWILGVRLFVQKERNTEQTLETSVTLVASTLNADDLFWLSISYDPILQTTSFETLLEYSEISTIETISQSLRQTRDRSNGDYSVRILSPDGYLILDADQLYTEPTEPPGIDEDEDLIRRSLSDGVTTISPPHPIENNRLTRIRRAYCPVFSYNEMGEPEFVVALVQLDYQDKLTPLEAFLPRRLTFIAVVSVILISLLWIFLNRVISRSLNFRQMAEQADRLRALGTVTAGVAHEIRNPLGIILLIIEEIRSIVKNPITDQERTHLNELADEMHDETLRLEGLTEQFLSFSRGHARKQSETKKLKPIREVTKSSLHLFSKSLPESVQLEYDSTIDGEVVPLEENQWRQIMLNLLQNALRALPGSKGTISVHQEKVENSVITTIKDNGVGMDSQTIGKIFDPFFTTESEGTGLGLPLAQRMIEDVKGTITVTSSKGKGTEIRVELPIFKTLKSSQQIIISGSPDG